MKGMVTVYNEVKGYGFIAAVDGVDYFFHRSMVAGHYVPKTGDRVSFTPVEHERGPRALDVSADLHVAPQIIVLGEDRIKLTNIRNYGITLRKRRETGDPYKLRNGDPRRKLPRDGDGDYVWEQAWEVLYVNTFSGDSYEYEGDCIPEYLRRLDEAHGVQSEPLALTHTRRLRNMQTEIARAKEQPLDGWEKFEVGLGLVGMLLSRL